VLRNHRLVGNLLLGQDDSDLPAERGAVEVVELQHACLAFCRVGMGARSLPQARPRHGLGSAIHYLRARRGHDGRQAPGPKPTMRTRTTSRFTTTHSRETGVSLWRKWWMSTGRNAATRTVRTW